MIDRLRFRHSRKSPSSSSTHSAPKHFTHTDNTTTTTSPASGMSDTSSPTSPDSPTDSWTFKLKDSQHGHDHHPRSNSLYSWREPERDRGTGSDGDEDWIRVGNVPTPSPHRTQRPLGHKSPNSSAQFLGFSPMGGQAGLAPGQFSPADLAGKVEYYRTKARELAIQVTDLQDLADHWQTEAKRLQKELKRLSMAYEDSRHELSAAQMALNGAHAFLDAPEESSEKEIVGEVVKLNEQIKKTAKFFVEAVPAMRMLNSGVDPAEIQVRVERGNMMVPPNLLAALAHPSKGGKNKLLEVAFEGCLADACLMFIEKWFPDATLDYWVRQMYDGIRGTALQSVFGRWRTLTRGQLAAVTKESTQMPLIFLKSVLDRFTDITTAVGISIDYVRLPSEWIKAMESKMGPVTQTLVGLRKSMGEMHVQSDMYCIAADPGEVFDETVRCLRNRAGASGVVDTVLCTTGLGVISSVKDPESEEMREVVLLEPEVALESYITTCTTGS